MNLVFNFLLLLLITSCSFTSSDESFIEDGYLPGFNELTLSKDFELQNPVSENGILTDIELLISNEQESEIVEVYEDSSCSVLNSTHNLSNGDNTLPLSLVNDGSYTFFYKLKKGDVYSECSSDYIKYSLDREAVVLTIDTIENNSKINNLNIRNFNISGSCNKENQEISVVIDGFSNFITEGATCLNSSFSINLNLENLNHGDAIDLKLKMESLSGLTGESNQENITVDLLSPDISMNPIDNISSSNQSNISFSGTCSEDNLNIVLSIDSFESTTQCLSGSWLLTNEDLSGIVDGNLNFNVEITDSHGNIGVATALTIKDTIAPSLIGLSNTSNPVSSKNWKWTCSESDCLYSYVVDLNTSTSPSNIYNQNESTSTNIDGTNYLHIKVKDSFGNESSVFHYSAIIDTSGPSNPNYSLINPTSHYSILDSLEFNIINLNIGDTLNLYRDTLSCDNSPSSTLISNSSILFNESGLNEGEHYFSFKGIDSINRESECVFFTYTRDLTDPISVNSISMKSPLANTSSKDNTPELYGSVFNENGSTINIYEDNFCLNKIGDSEISNDSFNVVNISYPIDGSALGLHHFYYKIIDKAGNESNCTDTTLEYTLEETGLAYLPKIAMVGNNSATSIISLEANNEIKLNGVVLSSSASKSEIVNTSVNQGDHLECSKACYPVTEGYGTAPWASEAYSGRLFSSFISRYGQYNPKISVASVEGNSFVEVIQNGIVINSALIDKNKIHEFTLTLTNNRPFLIRSTKNISAYFVARSNNSSSYTRDARVLTPSSTSVIGFKGYVTTIADNTNLTYSDNLNLNGSDNDLDANEYLNLGGTDQGKVGLIINSNEPISITQTADRNGLNSTPSIPTSMMAKNYGIPRNASYVAFLSIDIGTVEVYNPSGTLIDTINLERDSTQGPYQARYALDTNLPSSPRSHPIPAGTTFVCSTLCMAIYDDIGNGSDADETLMMGF